MVCWHKIFLNLICLKALKVHPGRENKASCIGECLYFYLSLLNQEKMFQTPSPGVWLGETSAHRLFPKSYLLPIKRIFIPINALILSTNSAHDGQHISQLCSFCLPQNIFYLPIDSTYSCHTSIYLPTALATPIPHL